MRSLCGLARKKTSTQSRGVACVFVLCRWLFIVVHWNTFGKKRCAHNRRSHTTHTQTHTNTTHTHTPCTNAHTTHGLPLAGKAQVAKAKYMTTRLSFTTHAHNDEEKGWVAEGAPSLCVCVCCLSGAPRRKIVGEEQARLLTSHSLFGVC